MALEDTLATDFSKSRVVGLAGADAYDAVDIRDEYLAVAHLAGLGRLEHRLDHLIDEVGTHRDLDPRLGHEIDHVLGAAIQLGVPALTTESLDFRNGHAGYADLRE